MTLRRFSSRTERLDTVFLAKALTGATRYLRIAGYFRSSIFELVGEEIAAIPEVKILCNSELDYADFQVASGRNRALKEVWNGVNVAADSLLHQERYQRLDALLSAGNVEIRVVPKERLFLHGKAGSITYTDGHRVAFMGSVNESRSAFASNYELVWQDDEPASADWVEDEFWELWKDAVPLPDVILGEISRVANREEVTVNVLAPKELPGAIMAEAPIYRGGEQLQPWQRAFVTLFLQHRETYGKVRLLLADEVGLGKTLSLATSALIAAILDDGPVLVLAPSTLTYQWQVELKDRLGIPSAVWSSTQKVWMGPEGQQLSPRGEASSIAKCPNRIAIVSTGLIFHQKEEHQFVAGKEAAILLCLKYGTVILDEAHKARVKGGLGQDVEDNNLLDFMKQIARRSRHVLLGTGTPIQTKVRELWDLLEILNVQAEFVLGDALSKWHDVEESRHYVTGHNFAERAEELWPWVANPLAPRGRAGMVDAIRDDQGLSDKVFESSIAYSDLSWDIQENWLPEGLGAHSGFLERENPILRHVVLRKRKQLEDEGLLEKVGVETHPQASRMDRYDYRFEGLGLQTNHPFQIAYEAAIAFCKEMQKRTNSAGFMKTLMLQRICSSFAAGLSTATKMLEKAAIEDEEDDSGKIGQLQNSMTSAERQCLEAMQRELSKPEARDPKLATVHWFLTEFRTEGKTWLEHGCIIFSQYYDTTFWVASELAKLCKGEPVGVYAAANKSGIFREEKFVSVGREEIKNAVKTRDIRLVVATDAACEGLNLQTLGTLINIDLPWNPSRLEQRLGRIKRFGQARRCVDMLNLVYHETQDELIYQTLSSRLKDQFDIFGSLPDTIEDNWIQDRETLEKQMDEYIHLREESQNAFDIRYGETLDASANRWELCAKVLSRKDIVEKVSQGW